MRKGFFVLVGACVVALTVSACGSGDDGEVTTSSLSKEQYAQKANEVCESATKRIEIDYGTFLKEKRFGSDPQEANYVDFVDTVVAPDIGKETEELRALGAPKGDEDEVEAVLEAREESIEIAEEDPEAVIENSDKVFAKASSAAEKYGLQACATR